MNRRGETVRSRYWNNEGFTGAPRRVNAIAGEVEPMELTIDDFSAMDADSWLG